MAGKSKRALADEAWLRLNTPDTNGALPGQLDLVAAIDAAERPPVEAPPPVDGIPHLCPNCNRAMSLASGWALSSATREPEIQCGFCGKRYSVTREAHEQHRLAIRNYFAMLPKAPPKKKSTPKNRGAR